MDILLYAAVAAGAALTGFVMISTHRKIREAVSRSAMRDVSDIYEAMIRVVNRTGADQYDRHKLNGVNLNGFKASNLNAIMTSFQANPVDNTWDLMIYTNDNEAWVPRVEFPSNPGDLIRSEYKLIARNAIELTIYLNGEKVIQTPYVYTWLNSRICFPTLILPWHGGKDDDGNGIGGIAPVDIDIKLNIDKNGTSLQPI